jgi:hypothetical protein
MRLSLHGIAHTSTFQIHGAGVNALMQSNASAAQQPQSVAGPVSGGALDLETRQKIASIQLNKKKNNIRFY